MPVVCPRPALVEILAHHLRDGQLGTGHGEGKELDKVLLLVIFQNLQHVGEDPVVVHDGLLKKRNCERKLRYEK